MSEGRDTKGQFAEGNQCASGRKGTYIPIKELIDTFNTLTQKKFNKSLVEYICDKALSDNKLLTALLKMMVEKQVEVVDVYDNNKWTDRTPREIVTDMNDLTTGS